MITTSRLAPRSLVGLFGVVALAALTSACGNAASPQAPVTETATVTQQAPAAPQTPATSEKSAALITVPDVSGMDHQKAQDTMQAAGLYNLREIDGKGLGRMLIIDKNWVQTGQDPAAGTKVPANTVITLTAVKADEKR